MNFVLLTSVLLVAILSLCQPPTLPSQFYGIVEITDAIGISPGILAYNGDMKKNNIIQNVTTEQKLSYLSRGDLVSNIY